MTLQQIAETYGRSVQVLRRHVRQGLLQATRVGGLYLVEKPDLDAYLAEPPKRGRPPKERRP